MAWRSNPAQALSGAASTTLAITVSGIGGAGPQNGDIVLLSGSWGASSVATFSCPGFLAVPTLSNIGYIGASGTGFVLYKVAGGSEPASYTVTASVSDLGAIQCNVASGRNTANPFTAASTSAAQFGGSPLSIACPSVTAAGADDQLFIDVIGNNVTNTSPTLTAPSGFSNVLNTFNSGGNPATNSATRANVSAGATGTVTGSVAFTGGANNDAGGYLISLAAASVAATPPYTPFRRTHFFVSDVIVQS